MDQILSNLAYDTIQDYTLIELFWSIPRQMRC